MTKIDFDAFICSIMSFDPVSNEVKYLIKEAIRLQGLEYKDGKIVEIDQPPLTDEQRAYIEEGLKNGSMIREKDLAYAEPKFKIGDWLVNKKQVGEAFCITQINKPYYYSTNLGSLLLQIL